MAKHEDFIAALRADIVRVLVERTGGTEPHVIPMASQIIAAMQQRFAGERLYVKAKPPVDVDRVIADFNYRNHKEVCRKHQISRRTLYRLLASRGQ